MSDTSRRPTKLTWLLLGLMAIEIGLLVSLRKLGWFETGNVLQMLGSILVMALPILIIAIVLLLNRFRLSLRMILILIALNALLLGTSVKPMLEYRDQRRGGYRLLTANARLDTEQYNFQHGAKWNYGLVKIPTIEEPVIWIPPWISYFVRDIQKGPADVLIVNIVVESDEQLKLIAEEAKRFSNLKTLSIDTTQISSEGISRLPSIFASCKSLSDLYFFGNDMEKLHGGLAIGDGLRGVSFYAYQGQPLSVSLVRELTSLDHLESISFNFQCANDEVLQSISPRPKLKNILLRQTDVTEEAIRKFRESNPDCVLKVIAPAIPAAAAGNNDELP